MCVEFQTGKKGPSFHSLRVEIGSQLPKIEVVNQHLDGASIISTSWIQNPKFYLDIGCLTKRATSKDGNRILKFGVWSLRKMPKSLDIVHNMTCTSRRLSFRSVTVLRMCVARHLQSLRRKSDVEPPLPSLATDPPAKQLCSTCGSLVTKVAMNNASLCRNKCKNYFCFFATAPAGSTSMYRWMLWFMLWFHTLPHIKAFPLHPHIKASHVQFLLLHFCTLDLFQYLRSSEAASPVPCLAAPK